MTTISGRVGDFTRGVLSFEVQACNVRALILELEERFSGLGEFVEEEMAIAIDGEIFQDALGLEIGETSEVVLIPRIAGG